MDKIPNQRLDWIQHAARPFALKQPTHPFTLNYQANDKTYSLDDYLRQGDVLGFLVLKDGQIVFEKYLHDSKPEDRFLSMSVSKSVVSVLFGVAVDEGKIHSVDDPVVQYLPFLRTARTKTRR